MWQSSIQDTKGTWLMREQCVPGSLFSSPAQEPGNEAKLLYVYLLLSHLFAMQNLSGQDDNLQPKPDYVKGIIAS